MTRFVRIFIFFLILSCNQKKKETKQKNTNNFYFPYSGLEYEGSVNDGKLDSLWNDYFTRELEKLNEPKIFKGNFKNEVYRFTIFSSFFPIKTYRIEKWNHGSIMISKYYQENYLIMDTIILNNQDFEKIESFVDFDFWNIKSEINDEGLDGATYLIEGSQNNNFHFVKRWSPKIDSHEGSKFLEVFDYLNSLKN